MCTLHRSARTRPDMRRDTARALMLFYSAAQLLSAAQLTPPVVLWPSLPQHTPFQLRRAVVPWGAVVVAAAAAMVAVVATGVGADTVAVVVAEPAVVIAAI